MGKVLPSPMNYDNAVEAVAIGGSAEPVPTTGKRRGVFERPAAAAFSIEGGLVTIVLERLFTNQRSSGTILAMELTIAYETNANPTAADIATALNARSFPEGWCITLDDNLKNDVMIDAEYDPIGTFCVSFLENRARRHAVRNLDATSLTTMMQKFLLHDEGWRDLSQWESPDEAKVRVKAEADEARKVRAAAAVRWTQVSATPDSTILSAVCFAILVFGGYCAFKLATQGTGFITDIFPKAEAKLAALSGGMGLAALLISIAFYRRSQEAQRWPKTAGRVIVSKVERYTAGDSSDGRPTRSFHPVIEFAYRVDGKEYRSRQRQLGVQGGGSETWAKRVKGKYRVGSTVEVHYNPINPTEAALENPIGMTLLPFGAAVFCLAVSAYALHVSG